MSTYATEPAAPPTPGVRPALSMAREKDVNQFIRKFAAVKRRRARQEKEWALNLAFYKGNQYAWHNKKANRIEHLPTEEGEKPRWRVRIVANQILPGVQGYVSLLTKTKPVINATPGSGSDADLRSAQVADSLYEYWYQDFQLDDKTKEALMWSALGAQGWWKVTWDPDAGKAMKFTLGPDGMVITDEQLAAAFKEQLEALGVDPKQFEQTVNLGDIRVEVMPPFHVWTDPTAKTFEEARWAICQHNLTPEEIHSRWGIEVQPDAVPADYDASLPFSNAEDKGEPMVKPVFIGYFLPGPENREGRYVVWIENPNKFLEDKPWKSPVNMLPLVKFPGVRYPGRVEDEAIVTHARPIQKELNRTLSQIVEHKNLTIKPQMLAPAGSVRQRQTDEPGAVYEYNPVNGERPQWRDMPSLPPYVFEHLRDMQVRLDRLFGQAMITRGEVPPNVEAGVAIDLLQETAVDQFAPIIQSLETALCRAGKLMVSLAQKYYIEPRLVKIRGEGGRVHVKKFLNADIDAGVDFHAEAGSGLPRTRAGKILRIKELLAMQAIQPWQALKHMDVADMHGVRAKILAAEEKQSRENDKILRGEIMNPEALQAAMGALQAGINPETGQAVVDPAEIQQVLERAVVAPAISDNHVVHLDVLSSLLDSVEFERWPMDARRRAFLHFEQHQQALNQPPMPEPQAPRTSLTIHSTMGPTGTSKILEAAGVPVTPEDAMEAPLESVVIDTIDKADVDEAGNDPYTDEERAHQAEQERQKAREASAKADLAEKRRDQSNFTPRRP